MGRLFIGLTIPEKVRHRVGEEADRLRLSGARVGWVKPDLYHVTVRFLGEVADRDLPEVTRILAEESAGTGEFKLVAKGLGSFPPVGSPRVIWCGVVGESEEEDEALKDLRKRLDRRLVRMGFRREKGRFHPHITLGRVRGDRHVDELAERMGPTVRREFGHFLVSEATLFESHMSAEGREYRPLARASLA